MHFGNCAAIALLLAAGTAAAETFTVDPEHSNAVFIVEHLGYSNMIGRFDRVGGEFAFDPQKPEASTATVVIETATVNTNHQRRDDHLRSPDFFNVQEFPTLTFVSRSVEVTGANEGKVTGDLTLLGVTRPVIFDVTFNKMAPHPLPQYDGILTAGFSARGTLRRTEFGMTYAIPDVADEVRLLLEIEGTKK